MAGFIASSGRARSVHANISYAGNTEIVRLILESNAVTTTAAAATVIAIGIAPTFPVTTCHVLHLLVTHSLVITQAVARLESSFQQEELVSTDINHSGQYLVAMLPRID